MALFDKAKKDGPKEASPGGTESRADIARPVGTAAVEPDATTTTPPNVPPASAVPDSPKPQPEPPPKPELEDWAKENGKFCTDKPSVVSRFAKMVSDENRLGIQPMKIEGPRGERLGKLYAYDMSPEKAEELLNGKRN